MKYLFLLICCSLVINAQAQTGWFINNAEIVSVGVFHDGANSVLQLKFKASPSNVDGDVLTCAPTWVDGSTTSSDVMTVTWWSSSNPNSTAQARYSTALSAQAQKLPVDLHVNTGKCASASAKPYGHFWTGIRFSE